MRWQSRSATRLRHGRRSRDRAAAREARGLVRRRSCARRERRRLPRAGDALGAASRIGRVDRRDVSPRPRGRSAVVRLRLRRGARPVRAPARRQRRRPEGRPRDRLRLDARRASPRDRTRGHRALRSDSRDRQEDGPARRARAEGDARDGRRRARAGDGSRRARRARRARLLGSRRRARARGRRSGAAARAARARGFAARGMSVVAREFLPEDAALDLSLRPQTLDDFVGQKRAKEQLSVGLDAAKGRGEALDHVLLAGPPGLGKTSLAYIIRNELGVGIRTVAGPAIERKGDMAAILTSLETHDVLFVDEIHRLNRAVEEILYPALEDFRLDIIVGQGPAARTLTLDLPPFTLVGATTRTGLLTTPLRDRFGMTFRLAYYEREELASIVRRSARILGVQTADSAADEIARRARGTPRVANRILRRVRDVAEVRHEGAVSLEIAREALELHEVDELGLERVDRELLRAIVERFSGGPVGLSTLAVALGEEPGTIEDVYEPDLLQLGFIQRTPRGRVVTEHGRAHLSTQRNDDALF